MNALFLGGDVSNAIYLLPACAYGSVWSKPQTHTTIGQEKLHEIGREHEKIIWLGHVCPMAQGRRHGVGGGFLCEYESKWMEV